MRPLSCGDAKSKSMSIFIKNESGNTRKICDVRWCEGSNVLFRQLNWTDKTRILKLRKEQNDGVCVKTDAISEDGYSIFKLVGGWAKDESVVVRTRQRKPKQEQPEPEVQEPEVPTPTPEPEVQEPEPEPTPEPKPALVTAGEVHCAKYERMLAKLKRGHHIYLHGPAGCGKSHTVEQLARDLGLEFYSQTTVQFAHDVRGYGDAGGHFVDTPFFKAFADEEHGGKGGLYFQDEYDRSFPEASIVLNTALANGYYDFPVIGRVKAHPNFRFVAAGNTLMKGGDDQYVTGQAQDASSADRFGFYFEVGYLHEVELHIAHNNYSVVEFVEDARKAIASTGISHILSYRATKVMVDEMEHENDLEACLVEGVFKGLDLDSMREIYDALENKYNIWARALKKVIG